MSAVRRGWWLAAAIVVTPACGSTVEVDRQGPGSTCTVAGTGGDDADGGPDFCSFLTSGAVVDDASDTPSPNAFYGIVTCAASVDGAYGYFSVDLHTVHGPGCYPSVGPAGTSSTTALRAARAAPTSTSTRAPRGAAPPASRPRPDRPDLGPAHRGHLLVPGPRREGRRGEEHLGHRELLLRDAAPARVIPARCAPPSHRLAPRLTITGERHGKRISGLHRPLRGLLRRHARLLVRARLPPVDGPAPPARGGPPCPRRRRRRRPLGPAPRALLHPDARVTGVDREPLGSTRPPSAPARSASASASATSAASSRRSPSRRAPSISSPARPS